MKTQIRELCKRKYKNNTFKKLKTIPENVEVVFCRRDEASIITSTFVVYHIKSNGNDFYFKEVCLHKNIRDYIFERLDNYCLFFESDTLKEIIKSSLNKDINLKKFTEMGMLSQADSPVNKFLKTRSGEIIGIEYPENNNDIFDQLKHFIKEYAASYILSYKYCSRPGIYETYFSSRQLAYQAVADALGLEINIPSSRYIRLKIDNGVEMFGIATDKALGIPPEKIDSFPEAVTTGLLKALENINLLDCICFEHDHAKGNLFYPLDEDGKIKSAVVFDNCGFNSFMISPSIKFKSSYQSALFSVDGKYINRPHMCKETVERLFLIKFSDFKKRLCPFLSMKNILCAYLRIVKIKKAVKRTAEKDSSFILESVKWNEDVLKQYTESKLNGTYIRSFMYSSV